MLGVHRRVADLVVTEPAEQLSCCEGEGIGDVPVRLTLFRRTPPLFECDQPDQPSALPNRERQDWLDGFLLKPLLHGFGVRTYPADVIYRELARPFKT